MDLLVTFVNLFVIVFNFLILGRVLMSWIVPHPDANTASRFFHDITEPLLAPIRKLLPQSNFDLSPLIAFFLLQGLQYLMVYLISSPR